MANIEVLYGVCSNDSTAMSHVRNACKDEEGFTAQLLKFTTRQNCLNFNVDGINIALRLRCANTSFVLIVFVANIVRPFVIKYPKNRLRAREQ